MVASVKSYKDNLKLQQANMSSDLAKTTCSDDTTSHHLEAAPVILAEKIYGSCFILFHSR
jgi:hypothetical protein